MSDSNNTNFIKAVRLMYEAIDQPIKLEEIAAAIGLSVSSLKRIFIDAIDQTPGASIRRLRMEFAFRSLQSQKDSILETALSVGFEDQSAFTRRFKKTFGYSPREARKKLTIVSELESVILAEPDRVELTDMQIQCVTETGLYFEAAPRAFSLLKNKLSAHEYDDDFSGLFIGIGHDNPHEDEIKEDQVRFTAGVTLIDRDLELDHYTIAGGSYARFRYQGKPNNMGLAYHHIYGAWAETSSNPIDKTKPAFTEFDRFPLPSTEHTIFIYVPLLA